MRNLISRSPLSVAALVGKDAYRCHFGLLTSPRNGKNIADALDMGAPWAADNDAWAYHRRGQAYDERPLLRALARWRPYAAACLFVVAPDVIADAKATLAAFPRWRDILRGDGFPVAFVVQNGVEDYPPPWGEFDALFIGGTNHVKHSRHVAGLVAEARRRGLWVHNGRVNTWERINYSREIGCDSFDGTKFTHDLTANIRRTYPHQRRRLQPWLFDIESVG